MPSKQGEAFRPFRSIAPSVWGDKFLIYDKVWKLIKLLKISLMIVFLYDYIYISKIFHDDS